MKVTEHNISNWELDDCEITELIRLVKEESKQYLDDRVTQVFYGNMIGKLLIMKGAIGEE